jgi:regulator of replication initiation timing
MAPDFHFLLEENQKLNAENNLLKAEIKQLRQQLGIQPTSPEKKVELQKHELSPNTDSELKLFEQTVSSITQNSPSSEKIHLFQSLFKGRNDVFAIIDQKIVWYGSINLLSFGTAEESMMRLVSTNVAYELMKSIESA